MRVPPDIAAAISKGESLGFACRPDGTVTGGFGGGWGGGAYPPAGYLPWSILDVGNGDTYGYYWPIGREDGPPIVCTVCHDGWRLVPVASSLAGSIRLHLLTGHGGVEELVDTARRFDINIADIPVPEEIDEEPFSLDGPPWTDNQSTGIEFWGAPSAHDLLPHDTVSPHLRFLAAKEAIGKRQLAQAEEHLGVALTRLPEYSDALALLAQVFRQQQNQPRTAESLMQAITSPLCFGAWERKKLLGWLQRLDQDAGGACDDPLWQRRNDLTFAEGVKENDDYRVFEELIDTYHRLGMGVRAVRLRVLTGELMGHETVSFRERYHWTKETYPSLLKSDLKRAGLDQRLVAVGGE